MSHKEAAPAAHANMSLLGQPHTTQGSPSNSNLKPSTNYVIKRTHLCQTCCCPAWVFFLLVADCKSCQRRPTPGDGLRQQQVLRQNSECQPSTAASMQDAEVCIKANVLHLASRLLQISHAPADAFPVLVEHGLEPRNGLPVFTRCTAAWAAAAGNKDLQTNPKHQSF
eukprot:365126-Chlamydomonas_euryale.AAC.60